MGKKLTKLEAENKLATKATHIKILEWGGAGNMQSRFIDTNRNVEFQGKFQTIIDLLNRNPNTVFNPTKKERQEIIIASNLKKYGAQFSFQSEKVKEKIKQTNLKKYGVEHAMKNKKISNKSKETQIRNGHIKLIKNKTQTEWASELGISLSGFNQNLNHRGLEVALATKQKGPTSIEIFTESILNELQFQKLKDFNYNKQFFKKKIQPDFYFPKLKLVIECDGLASHSNKNCYREIPNLYHRNKKEIYLQDGQHKFLHFWGDELTTKNREVIKQKILNKINQSRPDIFDPYEPLRFWWTNGKERIHHNTFTNELDAALRGYYKIWGY